MSKHRVYLNEFNLSMGRYHYLPIATGVLRANVEAQPWADAYDFQPFLFRMDTVENILAWYSNPSVAAFSVSMWNEQLNLAVAEEVKRCWPECLIVFGGSSVPHEPEVYMADHPFIDICVRGEGEEAFTDVLERRLTTSDYSDIPGVAARGHEACTKERPFERSLDSYPSPYLSGLYDDLMAEQGEFLQWQAVIETNRGCPFKCTFCFWGRGGLSTKYRYHDMDRVFAEIDWCGRNSILYVFNADSNFGMHPRDREIAEHIVAIKQKYGYPEKFRTCFGKNTDDKIFEIGRLLSEHDLTKGVTLARQSNDAATLVAVKRGNIKMGTYEALQRRFDEAEVPVYSEMILGLPNETVETWKAGIDELLVNGYSTQIFMHVCQVYPNTELAEPEYLAKYGIETTIVRLNEVHAEVRDKRWVSEYERIVVMTASMPHGDWKSAFIFSKMAMLLHGMQLGYHVLAWLYREHGVLPSEFIEFACTEWDSLYESGGLKDEVAGWRHRLHRMIGHGEGQGWVLSEFGNVYWSAEEASYLRLSEGWDGFYDEFAHNITLFLMFRGAESVSWNGVEAMIARQREAMPKQADYPDRETFARETVIYGRKSRMPYERLTPDGA